MRGSNGRALASLGIFAAIAALVLLVSGCKDVLAVVTNDVDRKFQLSVAAGQNGTVTPSGTLTVSANASTPLAATPNAGYHFQAWQVSSGTGVSFGSAAVPSTTVVLTASDAAVLATFAADPRPDIIISYASQTRAPGASFSVGACLASQTIDCDFVIQNAGTADLTISGAMVTGTGFSAVGTPPASTLTPQQTTTLKVRFTPPGVSTYSAAVIVTSNDSTKGTYALTISATATANPTPIITITQGGTTVPPGGDGCQFGNILFDGDGGTASSFITFVIANVGTGPLNLTGGVTLSAGNTADFDMNTTGLLTTIAPNASTSFTVRFDPLARGARQVTVQVSSDDPSHGIYTFTLEGTGVAADIQVTQGGQGISDGGSLFFGDCNTGDPIDKVFVIQNPGTSTLTLTSVTLSGVDSSYFSITSAPASSVAAGGSTQCTVRFRSIWDAGTLRNASLDILHNVPDGNKNPYNIAISGRATNYTGGYTNVVYSGYDGDVVQGPYPDAWVVYAKSAGTGIYLSHSSNGGATWGTGTLIDSAGTYASATFSWESNTIYVSYYDAVNKDLKFARYRPFDASPTWYITTVASTGDVGSSSDIVHHNYSIYDRTYICYLDATNYKLMCVTSNDNGATWGTPVTIDTATSTGTFRHPSIACIDQSPMYVAVSYMLDDYNGAGRLLRFAMSGSSGSSFSKITLDTTVSTTCGTAIDCHEWNDGLVAVAYTDASNYLTVATCSSWLTSSNWATLSKWTFTQVDNSGSVDQYLDLTLSGASPQIWVAYSDYTANQMKFAYYSGSSWTKKTPPQRNTGGGGRRPSISLFSVLMISCNSLTSSNEDVSISTSWSGADW